MSPPQADIGMLASQGNIGNLCVCRMSDFIGKGCWWCLDPSQLFVSCFTSLAASMRRSAAISRVLSARYIKELTMIVLLYWFFAFFDLQRFVFVQGRWGDASTTSSSVKRKRGGDPLLFSHCFVCRSCSDQGVCVCHLNFDAMILQVLHVHEPLIWFQRHIVCEVLTLLPWNMVQTSSQHSLMIFDLLFFLCMFVCGCRGLMVNLLRLGRAYPMRRHKW